MDWRTIRINGTNDTFLISIVNQSNDNFLYKLTNFKELWRENVDWQEILRRAKNENPFMNVNGEESAIERTIFSLANSYQQSATANEVLLKSKYYIGGVPFHFEWKLTKANADVFYEEITKKLLVTLLNVQDQRNELVEVVKRKDMEISQYKIEGATLMRKQIATEPFVKTDFERKFELESNSNFFVGNDNCKTFKNMCNYGDLIKDSNTNTLNVTEGPSPSKISKPKKNKEENAMRKFKAKKECKIKYESSCELLVSDEEMEHGMELKSEAEVQTAANSTKDQSKDVPKRKLNSKLNL